MLFTNGFLMSKKIRLFFTPGNARDLFTSNLIEFYEKGNADTILLQLAIFCINENLEQDSN